MFSLTTFSCPRSCIAAGDRWCRFRPLLDGLGPVKVDSHTATVKVEMTDPVQLRAAVEAMGGTWLGQGTCRMYDGKVFSGMRFHLPGWTYIRDDMACCVSGSELHYDTYNGSWGNEADITRLKAEYTTAHLLVKATELGWMSERTPEGVVRVYHPDGGVLTYQNGQVATEGFIGGACHEARESLGLKVEEGTLVETGEACKVPVAVQLPA